MRTIVLSFAFVATLLAGCSKIIAIEEIISQEALHSRAVGASAKELLSHQQYLSLKVEVQYMTGFAPDEAALAHLQQFLNGHLNKPQGITIVTKEIAPASGAALNTHDIVAIEKNNRILFTKGSEIAVYLLYTNGTYTDNKVLGLAYRNTSAVLFGNKIKQNSGGIGQPSRTKLEAMVLEHEVAHLIGLVDVGTPMQRDHKDDGRGNHCNNSNCLMYYTAETTDALGFLLTGNIPALDANCLADIRAISGK